MFDYKVKKSEDCVLINCNDWIQSSAIQICKISGKSSPSCITTALDVHAHSKHFLNCPISKGDIILLTKVASDVASMRSFQLEDNKNYFNLPFMQVLGIFKDKKINYDNLEMIYDKILVEKVEQENNNLLQLPKSNDMIGIVKKVGSNSFDKNFKEKPLNVSIGDYVLIKDNVSTPITLNEKTYYAVEEKAVVGIFDKSNFNVNSITFINESILMKSYHSPKVLNSILISPAINYEDLDYSDIYNRDLFQIKYLDKSLKKVKKEDIVLVKRDYTNYVYFNEEKYHLINGENYIEAKIEG